MGISNIKLAMKVARVIVMATTLHVVSLYSLIEVCGSPNCPSAIAGVASDIPARYVESFLRLPQISVSDEGTICNLIERRHHEFAPLLREYYETTTAKWRRMGKIRIAVIDDDGELVRNVKVVNRNISVSGKKGLEPSVDQSERVTNGEILMSWPVSSFAVELEIRKEGFRTARISFVDIPSTNVGKIYYESYSDLSVGLKLPPSSTDGPVRVLLRKELLWDPPVKDDGLLSIGPAIQLTPKAPLAGAKVLAGSDAENIIIAAVDGTYIVVNKDNNVVYCFRAFKGQAVGFADMGREYVRGKYVEFVHSGIRGPMGWKASNGPYKLYLYREAKPLPANKDGSITSHR